mmetsp:Transcript_99868/g.291347  ORF Transcript_99868/g.291347 Transcript_99868/m.291347 type:complete len:298 (+) Transcript_99868:349-1242(+)
MASRLHVVLALLFIKLALLLCSCILVLLVLRNQVVHVALSFRELHLIHALSSVPMQEGFTAEHRCEVLSHALEHLLDRCGVSSEGHGHLEALGRNVADRSLDVVRDPLNKVGGVLVLDVEQLLVDLLGGHSATEKRCGGQVAPVPRVSRAHHVLGIKHLLRELRHSQGTVLLRPARGERCEARHEEVQAWERDQVHCDLAEVAVQLARKAKARRDATHSGAHQVVQVPVCWRRELQRAETDVVQCLVIEQEALIGVLDKLVKREHGIVGFHDCVRDLWGWDHRERLHDAVWILFANL